MKLSSGSGAVWLLMYSTHTSSVTFPLLATQYPLAPEVLAPIPFAQYAEFAQHPKRRHPSRLKAWGFLIPYRGL